MTSEAFTHLLGPHPLTPCPAVKALAVTTHVQAQAGQWGVQVHYVLQGDIAQLRIPAQSASPGPSDNLWKHTCFEAFLNRRGENAYAEFNFSPSGHWAAYTFSDERTRDTRGVEMISPQIVFTQSPKTLSIQAWLPISEPRHDQTFNLGLAAVIETQDGSLSYWALHHPEARYDFHRKSGWTASFSIS
ncbi:DOMON-like domain-containing protein [Ottowia thiooxydans]|uniref:DOMON-like domain-containing protein n=1 Tax=Ottowia thiooxydans TaxID=219182 RepID=A0ABV2QHJ8_9BURK